MVTEDLQPGGACAVVRQQLTDLVRERLDQAQADSVRRHLAECESCSEVLAEMSLDEVSSNLDTLPPPPFVPPIELYEAFIRARKSRFGTIWKLVRDGLGSADGAVRDWALSRREAIGQALGDILSPRSSAPAVVPGSGAPRARGTVRTRGAIRTRGAAGTGGDPTDRSEPSLVADVVSSDSMPAGNSVQFRFVELPQITDEGRFRLRMETNTPGYAGQIAVCTIALAGGEPVSFTGVLVHRADADVCDVEMDEAGVSALPGEIPLDRVSLFVTRP